MANKYYTHFPVSSPQQASILSDEYTWTILDVLRKFGSKGLTPMEVHKKVEKIMRTSVSRSKIYGLLRQLYEGEIVHRYYDQEAKAHRNALRGTWGGSIINEKFDAEVCEKEDDYIKEKLFPAFFAFIRKAIEDLSKDSDTRRWLPQTGSDNLCKRCLTNHEAEEFYSSLLDIGVGEFLASGEFEEFLVKNGFMESEHEEE